MTELQLALQPPTVPGKKRKTSDDSAERRRCTNEACAHADPSQIGVFEGDCSGSDSDVDSRGCVRQHCSACRQLCWDDTAHMCTVCNIIVCERCRRKSMYTSEKPVCYVCRARDAKAQHCYRCVITSQKLWCRNPHCDTVYNVTLLLPMVYARNLALDLIPDHCSAAAKERIKDYEECCAIMGERNLEELSTSELTRILRRLRRSPAHDTKNALRRHVQDAMVVELRFVEEYNTQSQ